jgi:hypothetical protein
MSAVIRAVTLMDAGRPVEGRLRSVARTSTTGHRHDRLPASTDADSSSTDPEVRLTAPASADDWTWRACYEQPFALAELALQAEQAVERIQRLNRDLLFEGDFGRLAAVVNEVARLDELLAAAQRIGVETQGATAADYHPAVYLRLRDCFAFGPCHTVVLKGKGPVSAYFLEGPLAEAT